MNKFRVNRKHYIEINQIVKFVIKKNEIWIYLKKGNYPPILKTDYSFYMFRFKLTNLGVSLNDFKVEYDNE